MDIEKWLFSLFYHAKNRQKFSLAAKEREELLDFARYQNGAFIVK
jgi:hypothetical protein